MKCQNLFSGKNKENIINVSSAELAQTVVKVKLLRFTSSHCVALLIGEGLGRFTSSQELTVVRTVGINLVRTDITKMNEKIECLLPVALFFWDLVVLFLMSARDFNVLWVHTYIDFPLTCNQICVKLYHSLGKFRRQQIEDIFIFPRKQDLTFHANHHLNCMKCQSFFLGTIIKIFQYVICWKFYPEC